MFSLFLKGMLIGFSIALPVGPIGLLCIRNSIAYGRNVGLLTGLGAASADTVYGAIGGFGIVAVGQFLAENNYYLELIGGIFLCYLGIKLIREKILDSKENKVIKKGAQAFISTFFLTLTNPLTIISFAAVYAGLGVGNEEASWWDPVVISMGVFLGSLLWWFILSFASAWFRHKMSDAARKKLNIVSGTVLLLIGSFAIFHAR